MLDEHKVLINTLGGSESLNALYRSIKDIVDSDSYQTAWQKFWNNKQLTMCVAMCGTSSTISKPKEMFIERDSLDSSWIN
jgi:hypothetical protein